VLRSSEQPAAFLNRVTILFAPRRRGLHLGNIEHDNTLEALTALAGEITRKL
jgi:hypothetical protein